MSLAIVGILFWGKTKSYNQNVYYTFVCILIVAVVGFRSERMGADALAYRLFFLNPNTYNEEKEPGLYFVNSFLRLFSDNVNVACVIKAVLCLCPLLYLLKKESNYTFVTLYLFFVFSFGQSLFLLEFSMERQCFALAFFCVFLSLYINNNNKLNYKSIICLVLMVLFHLSSLLVCILLVLVYIRMKKIHYFIFVVVALLSLFFVGDYVEQVYMLADSFERGFYLSYYDKNNASLLTLLPFVGSFLVSLYFLPEKEIGTIWFKSFFLSVVLTAFLIPMGNNIDRVCAYFYVGSIICIPNTFKYITNAVLRYSYVFLILGYFTYRYSHVLEKLVLAGFMAMPYETFFQE